MEHLQYQVLETQQANADYEQERIRTKAMFDVVRELGAKLIAEGNQWCYIWGEMPELYIAGFGDTPKQALEDFYKDWCNHKICVPQKVTEAGLLEEKNAT